MFFLTPALYWYVILLLLGLTCFPLTKRAFGAFFDFGYPFGKTIAILLTSYLMFATATAHLLPFSQLSLVLIIIILFVINLIMRPHLKLSEKQAGMILFEELLFLISFMFWVWVRGQEPSIRGLEKFMDYGFINSALSGSYFPPRDMWLAEHTINYYFFGHIVGAVLTKLSGLQSSITYNLILATIFAQAITTTFSITFNLIYHAFGRKLRTAFPAGLLGTFIVNFGGNLHTIYTFTTGYNNEEPIPFWKILSRFTPEKYWYPNATRFIPFTIHEFPMYSYVVADLHGHVFDIPFVLLTLAFIVIFFLRVERKQKTEGRLLDFLRVNKKSLPITYQLVNMLNLNNYQYLFALALGFMLAVHYMTNAFDAGVYLLLAGFALWFLLGFGRAIILSVVIAASFLLFSLPFSLHFTPFASGIGVNCAPKFLTSIGRLGPFLFEAGNCQLSPIWMMMVLWGFFWFNGLFFALRAYLKKTLPDNDSKLSYLILIIFALSTLLILFPEAFYLKDIYPSHFRANTMFKLGYQAFMMMGIASTFVIVYFRQLLKKRDRISIIYFAFFIPLFFLIAIYPYFAIKSYYGKLNKLPLTDGTAWIQTVYPEYSEIISFLQKTPSDAVILEAQGDSYTDFNVVSAYSGRSTVAGWWVHQWLWRGSSEVVGNLIPDITAIYESGNADETRQLLAKHKVDYVIIGTNERQKYKKLQEAKFGALGQLVLQTQNGQGKIYKIVLDSF